MKPMSLWILFTVAGLGLLLAGCQVTRAGYETAPYTVVLTDGDFELRDYPALLLVETPMANANGGDGGFRRLFRFITGANADKQKIAMTTPVYLSGGPARPTMAFVMPATLKPASVPKPEDPSLAVREVPAGRFAVLRYSGGRNPKNQTESLERLQAWLLRERVPAGAEPIFGYFDPPWTPSFFRRNEVMLRTPVPGAN
jgi:hypothetical protein